MKKNDLIKKAIKLSDTYTIKKGQDFRLSQIDPEDTYDFNSDNKSDAKETLTLGNEILAELQDKLYAQDRWAVLLIFQAMDAAGKDGVIKHVMSGINPQGCQVYSFKAPSGEELDHDFMWRCVKNLPERGRIGIFNRSYYEETLIVRVHQSILNNQKLPESLVTKNIWHERFEDIRNFEKYLIRNGILICKFFLHISKEEQKKRFLDRINDPQKNWKFSFADVKEREYWDNYMSAYEDMIKNTATLDAPWYVVPADNKWFTRLVVSSIVIKALDSLNLKYPEIGKEKLQELIEAKDLLK
jgi:PPK2 family polyphosphate:nucleotide phosphotransferase